MKNPQLLVMMSVLLECLMDCWSDLTKKKGKSLYWLFVQFGSCHTMCTWYFKMDFSSLWTNHIMFSSMITTYISTSIDHQNI